MSPAAVMIAEAIQATWEAPFLISLAQWSLHRRILGPPPPFLRDLCETCIGGRLGPPERFRGDLDPLDFPVVARREFGIGAIEYIGYFYEAHVRKMPYLRELKRRCDGEGVTSVLVTCAHEGAIGDPNDRERRKVVQRHQRWMDMAAYLGCHSISVRVASKGEADEQARLVADGLHELGEWCRPHGLNVLVENHHGLTSDPAWLKKTLALADHPNVGMLPDWGNFDSGDGDGVYSAVEALMPLAGAVTAKCHDFGPDGAETTLDFARLVRIVRRANYRGHLGIEFEGQRLSEAEGILACKALLEKLQRAEMLQPA